MAKTIAALLLFGVFAVASAQVSAPTQDELSAKLARVVDAYHPGNTTPLEALVHASADFCVPIGIVWVKNASSDRRIPFSWTSTTVREIVTAIATTRPAYQVRANNGVLHVLPSDVIPDAQNFLNLKIDSFQVRDEDIELASWRLHNLVTPLRGSHQVSIAATGDSRVSLNLTNSTVQDILDSLAVASNRKTWIVTFSEESTLTSRGFRRTTSLWTDQAIPDQEQPIWTFLRWGDPLPPLVAPQPQ